MASREELIALMNKGFALVPVRRGSKAPDTPDWISRSFTPDDFEPEDNVGVKLGEYSGGLVDFDCDSDLVAKAAYELLPITLSHGRASRPNSHYYFRVVNKDGQPAAPEATQAWRDLTGGNLAELRSTKGQTVLPPSTHPSGEAITWVDINVPIRTATLDEILSYLKSAMIASVLAQCWPHARRHETAGHVAGFLSRYIKTPDLIQRIVHIAARLADDEEPDDRSRYARETAEKFHSGAKVTGGPRLKELLGEHGRPFMTFVMKLYDDTSSVDRLEEMNEKHFVVMLGSTMAVGTEPQRPGDNVVFQNFTEFERRYFNVFVGKKEKIGKKWLEWSDRRTYDRTVFAPPGSQLHVGDHDYNLWRGFVCDPLGTDPLPHITLYLDHIRRVICNDDEEAGNYVLDLMADCVQRPGDPPGKALVLRGGMGLGKSLFVEAFGNLFGQHFISVNHRSQLTGSFNGHLSGRAVVHADDAVWGGNQEDVGTLKFLTTQRTFQVTRKHVDTVTEPNFMHLFLSTNGQWAWPAGNRERRGVILDVVATRPREYFNALVDEIRGPKFQPALLAYLMARPVDRDQLLVGLNNDALREQQELSVGAEQQWWHMILEEGTWDGEPWPEYISNDALYDKFTVDMGSQRGAGVTHRGTKLRLSKRLVSMLPPSARFSTRKIKENVYAGVRGMAPEWVEKTRRVLVLPPLDVCREYYDRYTGTKGQWEPVPELEEQTELEL